MSKFIRTKKENTKIEIKEEGELTTHDKSTWDKSAVIVRLPNGTTIHIDYQEYDFEGTGECVQEDFTISVFRLKDTQLNVFDDKVTKKSREVKGTLVSEIKRKD